MSLSDRDFNWLIVKVIDSPKGLSLKDRDLCFNLLEQLSDKKLESLVTKVTKVASNPSTEGTLRKETTSYRPRRRRRPRPHKPQRKRGYNDKGTLADPQKKAIREIAQSRHLSVYAFEDLAPTLLSFVFQRGQHLLSEGEDYVDLDGLSLLIDELEEEGPLEHRVQWEIDELIDWVASWKAAS